MTTKYGVGKVYDFVTSPEEINGPPPVLRDRASHRTTSSTSRRGHRGSGASYMLTEDGKTVARAAYGRYYLPLSIEFLRRFGPDVPELTASFQMFEVGPWSAVDTNGDGEIDTVETRDAARKVARTPRRSARSHGRSTSPGR